MSAGVKLLRQPALHFALLGSLLYGLGSRGSAGPARPELPSRVVSLTAADMQQLREEFRRATGHLPDAAQQVRLIEQAFDQEVLYREALARGLDRRLSVVRDRLARLGGFLGLGPAGDQELLEDSARALGLARTDPVIRRHLVYLMELAMSRPLPGDFPTEGQLEAYYAQHRDRHVQPPRTRLTHVFLARDRHGAHLEEVARRLRDELQRRGVPPSEAQRYGDPFPAGARAAGSHAQLDRIFGAGFAQAIEALPERTWAGPVPSAYGLHVVWIHEHTAARVPPLRAVRNQVVHSYLRERGAARREEIMAVLRRRYSLAAGASIAADGRSGTGG